MESVIKIDKPEFKTDWPLISVITCFLNVDQFLEESIESVISQVYPNWELILIDDGSTDGSYLIGSSYSMKYSNIYLYQHEGNVNKGLSASRNLAIEKCSGELITFLDGDDIWRPYFLIEAHSKKNQSKAPVYIESTKYWYSWFNPEKEDQVVEVGVQGEKIYTPPELIYSLYPFGKGFAPCVCAILVDKITVEKHGRFNAAFKGMYEDQVFLTKMYLNEKIFISTSCNNIYRQRNDSLVYRAKQKGTYINDRKFFLHWFDQYIKDISFSDKKLNKILNDELFPEKHPFLFFLIETLPKKIKKKSKKIISLVIPWEIT